MTPDEYQALARRTAQQYTTPDMALINVVLGLTGESGETADHVKKYLFQGHAIDTAQLADELGDVLWYIAIACDIIGVSLESVMQRNIAKLHARYPDGFDSDHSVQR